MTNGSDVFEMVKREGVWKGIGRRVRESDVERQMLYERVRQAGSRVFLAGSVGALLSEFLMTLLGSMLGFWMITSLAARFLHLTPLYALVAFGFLFSLQATYYKYRLSVDPGYKIPKCRCASRGKDDSEAVLRSRESAILKVPNSAAGAVLYVALVLLVQTGRAPAATLVATLAVLASAYLAYVMVVRVRGLCSTCVNISAVNVLILWQLLG